MPVLIDTPIGPLGFDAADGAVTNLLWGRSGDLEEGVLADQLRRELAAYFAGALTVFTVPVAPRVTAFQHAFSDALCAIPYGETRTYGAMAQDLCVSAQAIG